MRLLEEQNDYAVMFGSHSEKRIQLELVGLEISWTDTILWILSLTDCYTIPDIGYHVFIDVGETAGRSGQ